MVSELAARDAKKLEAAGVRLSLEECVRLNALGLRAECVKGDRPSYLLPRVAIVEGLVIREPTLAQQIWVDDFSRLVNSMDRVTTLCASAFAYSTPTENLPDIQDVVACRNAIRDTFERIKESGVRSLAAALLYVVEGCDHTAGEFPPPAKNEKPQELKDDDDISVALAILLDGSLLRLGISLSEAKKLTRAQMESIRSEAVMAAVTEKGVDKKKVEAARKKDRYVEYLRYFEELRKRKNGARQD